MKNEGIMKTPILFSSKKQGFFFTLLIVLIFGAFSQLLYGQGSQTFTANGSFTVPASVTSITVECWGGGGAGGGQNLSSDGGGGGGGGAYSRKQNISVTPGTSYDVFVGAGGIGAAGANGGNGGDSYFINTSTVLAKGGMGGSSSTGTPPEGGLGGSATAGFGDVKYSGGQGEKGRNSNTGYGGYGGSSAGSGANGYSGPQTWSTVTYPTTNTPVDGGHGGNGGNTNANGSAPASGNGGGGGGSGEGTNKVGGNGAVGKVIVSWSCPAFSSFPLTESFDGTTFPPTCWSQSNMSRVTSGTYPTCSPQSGAGMVMFNSYNLSAGITGTLTTPELNLTDNSFSVKFWMYRDNGYASNADRINVLFNTTPDVSGAITLGTINRSISLTPVVASNGWYEYSFNLGAGSSGSGKYIIIQGVSAYGNNIFFDELTIESATYADFTASETNTYTGQSIIFTDASAGGSFTSWAWDFGDGAVPATANTQGPHSVSYTTTGLKTVSLTVDGILNNTKTDFITVLENPFRSPRQISASIQDFSDVTISWLSPALNDAFEVYSDFDLAFGSYSQNDIDGGVTYAIQDVTFPNSAYTGSFIAFNPSLAVPPLTGAWAAHSGQKYAACFATITASAPNNDWIITPRITVSSGEQLKFWAKSITSTYGLERFKVGISTSGTQAADFTIISSGTYVEAPIDWTEYTYDLSAYSGQQIYIGINCVSNDAFVFMIDDISIVGGPTESPVSLPAPVRLAEGNAGNKQVVDGPSVVAQISGDSQRSFDTYKVYRNGSEIANVSGFTYTDPDLVPGIYDYTVSAVYIDPAAESAPAGPAQVTPEITRWTGAVDNDWQTSGNWRTGQVPAPAAKIGVPADGISNFPVITQSGIECIDITLKAGASVQINPLASLSVSGTLTNASGEVGILIKSDATGTGSLIHNTSGIDATVERYIEAADWVEWTDGWHFISSPVASQTINALSGFVTAGPPADDFDLYAWHEPENAWVNFKNTTTSPTWSDVNNNSLNFLIGKGYMASYQVSDIKEFKGVLNVGDVSVSDLGISSGANQSWHLLGNPYASALAWDEEWTSSNIAGVAKIWNEAGQSYSDVTTVDIEKSLIPGGNGFMVEVTDFPGSLTIPAAKRIHSIMPFQKQTQLPMIELTARNLDHASFQKSLLCVNPMATNSYDMKYDGHFLQGYAPMFYSVCNNENLSVNCIPAIETETSIPFSFIKNEGSSFSIEARFAGDFPATVYLLDRQTGMDINLSQNPVYYFTASSNDSPLRFQMHFKTLGIENNNPDRGISVYAAYNQIVINSISRLDANVKICNLQGQQVLEARLNNVMNSVLDVSKLKNGVYVVWILSHNWVYSEKIILVK